MKLRGTLAAVALSISSACLNGVSAFAQGAPLPWGQPSDMVAWEVFVQITAPSGNPQSTNVEFETWASDQDTYNPSPKWPSVGAPKQLQVSLLGNARHGFRAAAIIAPGQCKQDYDKKAAAAAGFPSDGCIGEEVRRNWASFQYLVSNQLNTREGLIQAFANGFKVDLPADAIEFKGDWVKVTDVTQWLKLSDQQVHELYYTNKVTEGTPPKETEYALVAFHFSTKQIKEWVWADFEHQKNPGRCDDTGCHDSYGAVIANVPTKKDPNQQYGECKKSPAVQAMFINAGINPVWQNYCLKGSQITFVDKSGKATILGNSVIERINAGVPVLQSSCITCHQYASFDKEGRANFDALGANLRGKVDPAKLKGFVTNDFLWGSISVSPPPKN